MQRKLDPLSFTDRTLRFTVSVWWIQKLCILFDGSRKNIHVEESESCVWQAESKQRLKWKCTKIGVIVWIFFLIRVYDWFVKAYLHAFLYQTLLCVCQSQLRDNPRIFCCECSMDYLSNKMHYFLTASFVHHITLSLNLGYLPVNDDWWLTFSALEELI